MYAILDFGGKQHKVKAGDVVKLEKMEVGIGDEVTLDRVLAAYDDKKTQVGTPFVKGAKVTAEVVEQGRHKKVMIVKFRRRQSSMTRNGHRQYYTAVKIKDIKVS